MINNVYEQVLQELGSEFKFTAMTDYNSDSFEDRATKIRKLVGQKKMEDGLKDKLLREMLLFGPISSLLHDSDVTEILACPNLEVWFEKHGKLQKHPENFISNLSYQNIVQRLCYDLNIQVNLDFPMANAQWGQFRVHILAPPLSADGYSISIRKHPLESWNFEKLMSTGWADDHAVQFIQKMIAQKKSILIIGATGSGKTSVLNSCLQLCEPNERIIAIEDTAEIKLPNSVSCRLLTRLDANKHLTLYSQTDLLKESLRMRPDRIVVGEVRGGEAKDLLMALSTGHSGGLFTLHADNPKQAMLRLEMLIQMGAPQWNLRAIRQLMLLGINYIITVKKEGGKRKLESIFKITSLEETGFCFEKAL